MRNKQINSISELYIKEFKEIKKKTDVVLQPKRFVTEQVRNDCIETAKKCNEIWSKQPKSTDNVEALSNCIGKNETQIKHVEDSSMVIPVSIIGTSKKNMQHVENTKQQEKERNAHIETLSMSACAKRLQKSVRLISLDKALYYFNGLCYQIIDNEGLIELYRKNVDDELHGAKTLKLFSEVYDYLLTDSKIRVKPDEENISNFVVLKNGIYDLRDKKLKKHTPEIISFSYVNASYVEDEKCPTFDKFLDEVTKGDKTLIERMWMVLGYILTQSMDAKAFFVMGQASNSGKSLFGHFIQKLFDSSCVSAIALSDMNGEFSLGQLVGKTVNISLDLPHSKVSVAAASKLKMLTGGDLITVNEKYRKQFKYQNRAKFIFASNHPIQLTQDDDAFWERLVFLPFDYSVSRENQNENLLRELLDEKDAVVSNALKYARKLMKRHYQFPTTPEIEKRVRAWRGLEIDTINDFIQNCCLVSEENKGELMEDLYREYIKFCIEQGETYVKQNEFKRYLEDQLGLVHRKMRRESGMNPQSAFCGIQLYSK